MINNYKVITLCGSTRFKDAYIEAQKRLTLEGYIVISVGLFGYSGDDEAIESVTKEKLDRMHLSKIDMADEIYVINVDGYIGESTKHEIEYAKSRGKVVRYLKEPLLLENNSFEYWPTIDDYISAVRCPLESLNKLKRFRPYILPDGSLDYWNDKNRIVFRMIDSIQGDYEVGMECALTFEYWTTLQNEMRSNIDNNRRIYNNELIINNNDIKSSAFPVIIHKEYEVENKASAKHVFSVKMKEKYVLSEDKKTLLSWNMDNVQLGDSVDYGVCIPEGVENIADGAFSGCDKIYLVIFPKSLRRIGNWAFAGSFGFKAIFKCEQLEEIGEYAFYGCFIHMEKGLDNLPKTIKKIDETSFKDCRIYSRFQGQYYSVNIKKSDSLWHLNLLPEELKPETNFETELDRDSLFYSSKEDEYGVVYDASYTYILECKNKELNSYKVKNTTIGILQNSFADLEKLTEIDLSDTQHIGDYAFSGCKKLSVVKMGKYLKTIGKCAFSNTGILKLKLPVSLVKMDSAVFENCKELEEVQINSPLEKIPDKTFNSCSALHTVIFRKTIKIIERLSFARCSSLKNFKLPNGIRQLGELCFASCKFETIVLPKSLIIMEYSPFCGCKDVHIVSESPFFYANEKFLLGYNRTRLISYLGDEKNIVIPGSVREILGYSLCNRGNDSKIFLPDSVNIIGHWAFRSACAECINFPKSLFYIKSGFDYCGGIKAYMINDSQKEYLKKITMYNNNNLIMYQ